MPPYLKTHLLLQLPFGLLSMLPTLMLLSLAVSTQIRAVAKGKVAKVNFILMTLTAPNSDSHIALLDLYHMSTNEASLIVAKGDQLLDETTVASLAFLLDSAGVTQMH